MALPSSSTAKARLWWRGQLVPVSVRDVSEWKVPAEHPDLADYLAEYHTHHMFEMPGRVDGEPAHDLLEDVVDLLSGEMLTRKLPIPPAEPGLVY